MLQCPLPSFPPNKIKSINLEVTIFQKHTFKLIIRTSRSSQPATRLEAINTLNSFLHSRGHNYTLKCHLITAEKVVPAFPYLAFGQIWEFPITEKRIRELRGVDTKIQSP